MLLGLAALPAAPSPAAGAAGHPAGPAPGIAATVLAAAGIAGAGLLVTLTRVRHSPPRPGRRGHHAAGQPAGSGADGPIRADGVRTALAVLTGHLLRTGQPLPPAAGIHLTASELDILLLTPAPAPFPFRLAPGTRDMCWRITASSLAAVPASPGAAGGLLPGLLTAGVTAAGGHLLIDLEAAGITTVAGPAGLVDRYLVTAAAELSANPWAGDYDLILEGFPGLAAAAGARARACRTLDEAIAVLEGRAGDSPGRAARQQRLSCPAPPGAGLTVLAARTCPAPAQIARLLRAVAPASGIAVILPAGPAERSGPACLALRQDDAGAVTADVHPLALAIAPRLLDETAYRALAGIFAATAKAAVAARPRGGRAAAPGPASRAGDRAEKAALRIAVIGPAAITGTRDELQPKQAELVIALALAGPSGLTGEALRGILGPDEDHPKPADQLRQVITRTRRKLGTAPDGSEYITRTASGHYVLHPAAVLDWHEFRSLARSGRHGADPGPLRAAMALQRGQPFEDLYYWWLDTVLLEEIRAGITEAAGHLSALELQAGDPAAAARAARAGLAADLAAEPLWRALMRAEDAAGSTAGVHDAWRRCLAVIGGIAADGQPHPATAALYRELTRRHGPRPGPGDDAGPARPA